MLVERLCYWQIVKIGRRVMRYLAAMLVYGLVEITLAIENSYGHKRNTQVTRCLAMVAGQDTQAT